MRALSVVALLVLASCGTHTEPGIATGGPGVDVAEAAFRGGSPQVALQIDSSILAKNPRDVPALLNRGDVLTSEHLLDQAADSYSAALQADANSVPARIGLGRIRLADNAAAAEQMFLEALQRDPHNAIALNDLGIARDLQGRHEDAQKVYRQAIGVDSSMTGARVNLALSLAMTGHSDAAAPMLRPLADQPAAPLKFRHDLAAVLAMGGERDEAQRILAKDLSPEQVNQALAIYSAASAAAEESPPAAPPPAPLPTARPTAQGSTAKPPAKVLTAKPAEPPPAQATTDKRTELSPATWLADRRADLSQTQSLVATLTHLTPAQLSSATLTELPNAQLSTIEPAPLPSSQHLMTKSTELRPAQQTSSVKSTGGITVQLASLVTSELADSEWQTLRERMPTLLANREPIFRRVDLQGQVRWRVRTGGFADSAEAETFCRAVKARGAGCYVTGS